MDVISSRNLRLDGGAIGQITALGVGLLLIHQFLLARHRRAFLQDSPTPGWLATLRSPGANFLHASGVQTSSPKGLHGHSIPGVTASLYPDAR